MTARMLSSLSTRHQARFWTWLCRTRSAAIEELMLSAGISRPEAIAWVAYCRHRGPFHAGDTLRKGDRLNSDPFDDWAPTVHSLLLAVAQLETQVREYNRYSEETMGEMLRARDAVVASYQAILDGRAQLDPGKAPDPPPG